MHSPLRLLLKDKGHAVYHISPAATVHESAIKMKELGVGALLVMEEEQLLDIISERDIIRKLVGCACDPGTLLIQDIMTKNLITVTPNTTVQEAIRIVTEKRLRHLPVLEQGKLVGLISIGDLTKWIMLEQEKDISNLKEYIQGSIDSPMDK